MTRTEMYRAVADIGDQIEVLEGRLRQVVDDSTDTPTLTIDRAVLRESGRRLTMARRLLAEFNDEEM